MYCVECKKNPATIGVQLDSGRRVSELACCASCSLKVQEREQRLLDGLAPCTTAQQAVVYGSAVGQAVGRVLQGQDLPEHAWAWAHAVAARMVPGTFVSGPVATAAAAAAAPAPALPDGLADTGDLELLYYRKMGKPIGARVADLRSHLANLLAANGVDPEGNEWNCVDIEFNFVEYVTGIALDELTDCLLPENQQKNRYANVVAPDHTRVRLQRKLSAGATDDASSHSSQSESEPDPTRNYINANWIAGNLGPKTMQRYVAAQGPLPNTVDDFWLMIWETGACVVVMLTGLIESDRCKCEQYWSEREGEARQFGDITVRLVGAHTGPEVTRRAFRVRHGRSSEPERAVAHFQYTAWPDFGSPETCDGFLQLVQDVDDANPQRRPLIVHCSAGIGRTGTFCLVHAALEEYIHRRQCKQAHHFAVLTTLVAMRRQRPGLVQTKEQLEFCYRALVEAVRRYDVDNGPPPVANCVSLSEISAAAANAANDDVPPPPPPPVPANDAAADEDLGAPPPPPVTPSPAALAASTTTTSSSSISSSNHKSAASISNVSGNNSGSNEKFSARENLSSLRENSSRRGSRADRRNSARDTVASSSTSSPSSRRVLPGDDEGPPPPPPPPPEEIYIDDGHGNNSKGSSYRPDMVGRLGSARRSKSMSTTELKSSRKEKKEKKDKDRDKRFEETSRDRKKGDPKKDKKKEKSSRHSSSSTSSKSVRSKSSSTTVYVDDDLDVPPPPPPLSAAKSGSTPKPKGSAEIFIEI